MERLSTDDIALIDELFKTVFRDILGDVKKIKAEHPEEWAEYEKMFHEYLTMTRPDISRRYYGKGKLKEDHHGKETENAGN